MDRDTAIENNVVYVNDNILIYCTYDTTNINAGGGFRRDSQYVYSQNQDVCLSCGCINDGSVLR